MADQEEKLTLPTFLTARFPSYLSDSLDWDEWRLVYCGGKDFRDRYLEFFSTREDKDDFARRKRLTPVPSFAKSALNDVRNSIFQRFVDITRQGGSQAYQEAIAGQNGGVDNRGSSMNGFIGQYVLTELLLMGRVGIYVDMPVVEGPSLADAKGKHPYLYVYCVEDILNWRCSKPEDPSEFQSLLLRDSVTNYDHDTLLPIGRCLRYRKLWIDQVTGFVNLQFYDEQGLPIDKDGNAGGGPVVLEGLTKIPFVMPSIGDSLIKDAASFQIALLNLASSDLAYALQSNFPFYTEQKDMRNVGGHLKRVANEDGTATAGGQGSTDEAIKVGTTQGRYYDLNAERPGFINPSSEPLKASMELQDRWEQKIRMLINLAIINIASRASAESKTMDNEGLNAGLSFIGLVLQAAEMRIASFWAAYEDRVEARREVAIIVYPERYSLKNDSERLDEGDKFVKLIRSVPSNTAQKAAAKRIATTFLGEDPAELRKIHSEIDASSHTTRDPEIIKLAREQFLASGATLAEAAGFDPSEADKAHKERIDVATEVAKAQGIAKAESDPAARGIPEASSNPNASRDEKKNDDGSKKPVRGEAA